MDIIVALVVARRPILAWQSRVPGAVRAAGTVEGFAHIKHGDAPALRFIDIIVDDNGDFGAGCSGDPARASAKVIGISVLETNAPLSREMRWQANMNEPKMNERRTKRT